jgi:hypothetical protein
MREARVGIRLCMGRAGPGVPGATALEIAMRRLLCAAAIAALALGGCEPKKPPNPPTPKTRAIEAMVEATPSSDPSLPSAATVLAAQQTDDSTVAR